MNTFKAVDANGDGFLSKEELFNFYNNMINGDGTGDSNKDAT